MLHGVSLGGYVTALTTCLDGDFDAVIAGIPICDFPALFAHQSPRHVRERAAEHQVRHGPVGQLVGHGGRRAQPRVGLGGVRGKILFEKRCELVISARCRSCGVGELALSVPFADDSAPLLRFSISGGPTPQP